MLAASRDRTWPKARANPAWSKMWEVFMPTFMCFLNWTDQGARGVKDAPKRYEASKAVIAKLGGRLVSAYVTTGQYDVVLTVEMPNGDAMTKSLTRNWWFSCASEAAGDKLDAGNHEPGESAFK
jgi:uncharacterized protein with GYD domain